MKYIVYCTVCTENNKIYIGVHKTKNPNIFDGYIGCGVNINCSLKMCTTPFQHAVKKYGFDKFKRYLIQSYDTLQEALELESILVNEDFISREDTYNITLGGGMPPDSSKKIYQYNLKGEFIKEYNSVCEASLELGIGSNVIGVAATYKRTSGTFLWSFDKLPYLNIEEFNIYSPEITVYCYDSDRNFYKTFNSMSECCKELNCTLFNVQRGIKLGTCIKGFYVSNIKSDIFQKPISKRLTGKVHQYDTNGNYIQSFDSVKEAESKLQIPLSDINSAIKLNNSYYKGYLWCRGEKLKQLSPYKPKSKARKIAQYTMEGELVKIFNTLRECRKEFPNVSRVLNGTAKHCHHFIFKYY